MATKKHISVMDTTFRDGLQSVYGGRVLIDDILPAVKYAKEAGISHFEFGGGARFQSLFFYLQENAFESMDKFRAEVGQEANLQTLSRGVNTVMLDTSSKEMINLHAKLFKKHSTTTIRNFDALNDVRNLQYSGECIKKYSLNHEVAITMMELPPNCSGAHDVEFYERVLRNILDSGLPYDSICFKDASGTSSPKKVYETIKMARKLVGNKTHIRMHTHDTIGVGISVYLAALDAGVDGIDLANSPVSGGTSQPDILTMMQALKGSKYSLGFESDKIFKYQETLKKQLDKYYLPPEATRINPLIALSPMPGGALTANTQMMRDEGIMDKFPAILKEMKEVVVKGGYGTSATPVSQFYWQQAYSNVMFGSWKEFSNGYGKMILGYFGKTPVEPDREIVKLASKKLNLEPTNKNPLELAEDDVSKKMDAWIERLELEEIETTEENVFIAASCGERGIAFLKGISPLSVRYKEEKGAKMANGNYTVVVDGEKFNVSVADGDVDIKVTANSAPTKAPAQPAPKQEATSTPTANAGGSEVVANVSGNVWKILKNKGDSVQAGEVVLILEAMKMEIEIEASTSGTIGDMLVNPNDAVNEGQVLATIV